MKEKLLKIINNYGVMPQLKYFQSEVFELNEAIINHELKKTVEYEIPLTEIVGTREHIAEEIADVQVMLAQFQYYYGISDEEIWEIMKYKVDRQLERIKEHEEELAQLIDDMYGNEEIEKISKLSWQQVGYQTCDGDERPLKNVGGFMKKIKIIDLLNKITKGEEVPKKIIYKGKEYHKNKGNDTYYLPPNPSKTWEVDTYDLNDEIEIIEEDKDIEELKLGSPEDNPSNMYIINENGAKCFLTKRDRIMALKINELIDEVNKLKRGE